MKATVRAFIELCKRFVPPERHEEVLQELLMLAERREQERREARGW